ncbi:MAG TPA: GreA/GreB family elongation factor [Acidobacteriota bacterium]|nr:GreA/GreB family elongation factor [Acidobacteriota bacterium]
MIDKHLQQLIDSNQFDQLDEYWLELMESGQFHLEDLLASAKALGRNREKQRAGLLMTLLDEHLREHERWHDRIRVLKEITRHTLDLKQLENMKDEIRDTFAKIYRDSSSLDSILRFYSFNEILNAEELAKSIGRIEEAFLYDVGQVYYQQGYGVGRVREVNLKLRFARIDFEKRPDVTVQFGDPEVHLLPQGHILREKVVNPDQIRADAEREPSEVLGRLLQTFDRPMTAGEIKECLTGIVDDQWSRWWTAAKKNPQLVTKGKGAQAVYSWSGSATEAEESVRKEFEAAKINDRINLARTHAARSQELSDYFAEVLVKEASKVYEAKKWDLALELLDLFQKWPGKSTPESPYTFEQIVKDPRPAELLTMVENQNHKTRILMAYREGIAENWKQLFTEHFYREENPRVLSLMLEQLQNDAQENAEAILTRLVSHPSLNPAAFAWLVEMTSEESPQPMILQRIDGKLLLAAFEAIDASEFAKQRNRIKKAIESGLLMNAISRSLNPEVAQKALDMLDHTIYLEDYRKDRWKNVIRSRIPETKKKEDWIFSTREAFERKRGELEQLIKVELPLNRKAVGEAAAHGDLRENHEYKAARERQDYLINRVTQLQGELNRVRVLEPGQIDCSEVRPGTRVKLVQPGDKRMVLTLLGPWDSNPQEGVYSYQAKIGTMLLGKLPGEKIEWNDEHWTVEEIEPWS